MSKAFDELMAHTNSVLTTLDKDYEAMQIQKSNVRDDQAKVLDTLIGNMRKILAEYEPILLDFSSKIERGNFDISSENYEVCRTDTHVYYYKVTVYWTNNTVYFKLNVRYASIRANTAEKYINYSDLYVSCEESEMLGKDFNVTSLEDFESVFLNHAPDYEQLKIAFEEAVTEYVKTIMQKIQERNERLADKIKEVTK